MPSNRVRVLVAVPDRLYLDALCRSLTRFDGIVSVAETTDARRAIELAQSSRAEVAVFDFSLWKQSWSALERAMRSSGIATVLLCANVSDAVSELSQGASEAITLDEPLDILIAAIRAAARRQPDATHVPSRTTAGMGEEPPPSALTAQEIKVLRLLTEGLSNKEISETLHVAVRTVENHRSRLAKKLGIRSAVELTRYAIRQGVIKP